MGLALRKHPDDAARFTDSLRIRCPASLPVAIDTAAARKLMTPSEYVRRCVIERLEADGIEIATIAPRDAEYALVAGDRVLTRWIGDPGVWPIADHCPAGYVPTGAERWLPIEEECLGYDPKQHWKKTPPTVRLEADRVVRVFDLIPKTLEAI
jgi:hypothetical protein